MLLHGFDVEDGHVGIECGNLLPYGSGHAPGIHRVLTMIVVPKKLLPFPERR